ncbi:hypothetical protein [Profundibacter sp.]
MQIFGVSLCELKGIDFQNRFLGQFILAKDESLIVPGWEKCSLNNWILFRDKSAETVKVVDTTNTQIGWFLGIGVKDGGEYIGNHLSLPYNSETGEGWREAEKQIEGIAGRYCIIIDTDRIQRVYGDPVGDFSVLFNSEEQIVASSTFLALTRDMKWNTEFNRERVLAGEMHFTLQETPDTSLRRTIPNHFLDLDSFKCVRHWPLETTSLLKPDHSVTDNLDQISNRLKQIISSVARSESTILPISGGQDSRNLVGAAEEEIKHIRFGFAWQFHRMSRYDARIGKEIAKRSGIPFSTYTFLPTTRPERLQYFMRTGYADGGSSVRVLGIQKQTPKGNIILRGNVMELLRANQWDELSITQEIPRISFGIKRLLIDTQRFSDSLVNHWKSRYEAWADTLPEPAKRRQLDFGFTEHLLPNTLGVRHFGFPDNFVLNPFADRRLIQLSMQIPPAIRKQNIPNKYLLERNCGQFQDIPYERELSSNPSLLP